MNEPGAVGDAPTLEGFLIHLCSIEQLALVSQNAFLLFWPDLVYTPNFDHYCTEIGREVGFLAFLSGWIYTIDCMVGQPRVETRICDLPHSIALNMKGLRKAPFFV